jgi:hypothetical protein
MVIGAKQVWRRLGRVIEPQPTGGWWLSHASYPTALVRKTGPITVFFSVRDAASKSSLASVEINIDEDRFDVGPVRGPSFTPGPRGAFDADGVTVTSFVQQGERLLAYYLGWTKGVSVPFTNFIGLAEAQPDGSFKRLSAAPIVGRSAENPFTLGYPWVTKMSGEFRMWFGSHLFWGESGLEMNHVIKQASSTDGMLWTQMPGVAVPLAGKADVAEFAVSRPVVLQEADDSLSMWYARRNPQYCIGYAVSADRGLTWQRKDELFTIEGELGAWESQETTYPCVFDFNGNRYMLYNGNGYGRTGFGLAKLET